MQVISYNSRILTTQEQKLSTYDRELCAITFALSHYEFIVIDSKFQISIFTDQNPILFLFTRKGNLTPKQNKAQMLLTSSPVVSYFSSPSKYYPRSRERSSSYTNSSFKRYNSPYRPTLKPRNNRCRSRSHSNSKNYSQFQYKPSNNLTHT